MINNVVLLLSANKWGDTLWATATGLKLEPTLELSLRFLVDRYKKLESSWEVNSLEVLLGLFSFCFSWNIKVSCLQSPIGKSPDPYSWWQPCNLRTAISFEAAVLSEDSTLTLSDACQPEVDFFHSSAVIFNKFLGKSSL